MLFIRGLSARKQQREAGLRCEAMERGRPFPRDPAGSTAGPEPASAPGHDSNWHQHISEKWIPWRCFLVHSDYGEKQSAASQSPGAVPVPWGLDWHSPPGLAGLCRVLRQHHSPSPLTLCSPHPQGHKTSLGGSVNRG